MGKSLELPEFAERTLDTELDNSMDVEHQILDLIDDNEVLQCMSRDMSQFVLGVTAQIQRMERVKSTPVKTYPLRWIPSNTGSIPVNYWKGRDFITAFFPLNIGRELPRNPVSRPLNKL